MDNNVMTDYIPAEENEVLFENTHVRDRDFFKEFYFFAFFKRPLMIAVYVLMAIYFVASILLIVFWDQSEWFGIIVPTVYLLWNFLFYKLSVKNATRRQEENENDGQIVYTTRIAGDRLRCQTSHGADFGLELTKIKRVVCTKNYLLLHTQANQMYPFLKNAFTKGTYEDFCEFLRAKGYKVKG